MGRDEGVYEQGCVFVDESRAEAGRQQGGEGQRSKGNPYRVQALDSFSAEFKRTDVEMKCVLYFNEHTV